MNNIEKREDDAISVSSQTDDRINQISVANRQRAITEIQASITIAKNFPRDEESARQKIITSCGRRALASVAIYSYPRGDQEVSGPSIRLVEEIGRQWGNIDYGWRVLDVKRDSSEIETFAWDKETNVRQTRQFRVSHKRTTKKGEYVITDPRDIYEKQANEAARRMRANILALIPNDIVEEAVSQCEQTMRESESMSPETIKKLIEAFKASGVSQKMLETRIRRRLDSIQPAQVMQLRKIYNSLRDGMSSVDTWFAPDTDTDAANGKGVDGLKKELLNKKNEPKYTDDGVLEQEEA